MITKEELKLLCELSRLHLDDDEFDEYVKEMTDIMNLMDSIGESNFEYNPIDTENATPFASLRDDTVERYDNMDKIVEIGPDVRDNSFVVPKVVD